MAFISMLLSSLLHLLLCIATVIGVLLLAVGILFFLLYLVRKKKKPGKGFLAAAIVMVCIGLPMTAVFPVFSMINAGGSSTVTIGDTVYRNGFSGDLYPLEIDYQEDYITVRGQEFHRVNNGRFDMVYTPTHSVASPALYCSEEQWEEAKAYYADSDTFIYYGNGTEIPHMDAAKFDALMAFADENGYKPFGPDSDAETCRLPMPDMPALIFHKESRDGMFTSFKGHKFHVIDGKFYLVYYYDMGHGEYQELVAVEVPEELGSYFMGMPGSSE